VFDGTKGSSYIETDVTNPLNVYGKTKLEGEQAIQAAGGAYLILRTSWVYSMRQGGFVTKVLQWAREQDTLRVVDDQISSPTWARMLAEATALILAQGRDDPADYIRQKAGLYHLAGSGSSSRFEWAQEILELDPQKSEQKVRELLPAKSSEFPTPAERPLVSVLECGRFERTFGLQLPAWQEALQLALD
jgi:dTDP-4-dehydrorhamnose reductase